MARGHRIVEIRSGWEKCLHIDAGARTGSAPGWLSHTAGPPSGWSDKSYCRKSRAGRRHLHLRVTVAACSVCDR